MSPKPDRIPIPSELPDPLARDTFEKRDERFAMTCPRLRPWEATVVISLLTLGWWLLPKLDTSLSVETFTRNERVSKEAAEDYWRMRQKFAAAQQRQQIVVIGDSVIWGEYVDEVQTLTAYLNESDSSKAGRYVNGGVNGMHPLAIEGLVADYGRDLRNTRVVLHCNLLWLTSRDRDLSTVDALSFNHPRLIPQLVPRIPAYRADAAERISAVVERSIPFRQWVRHQWITYFDGQDLLNWSLEHPDAWPSATGRLRPPDETESSTTQRESRSWIERGIPKQKYDWVALDDSLQWHALQQAVRTLQQRGNRVFVLIGPFNAHMLEDASYAQWNVLRGEIANWMTDHDVDHHLADVLPSHLYADASHPLADGYRLLAMQLDRSTLREGLRATGGSTSSLSP